VTSLSPARGSEVLASASDERDPPVVDHLRALILLDVVERVRRSTASAEQRVQLDPVRGSAM
jgi:hypothetical protein